MTNLLVGDRAWDPTDLLCLIPTSGFRFQPHMCSWVALRHSGWVLGVLFLSTEAAPISNSPAASRLWGRRGTEGSSPLRGPMSAAIVWGTAPWPGHGSYPGQAALHRVGTVCLQTTWGPLPPSPQGGHSLLPPREAVLGCGASSRLPLAVLVPFAVLQHLPGRGVGWAFRLARPRLV